MALLTRQQIDRAQPTYRDVYVADWGGTVRMAQLSGSDVGLLIQAQRTHDRDNILIAAQLVVRVLVDEHGNRLYQDGDAEALVARPGSVQPLMFLLREILDFNGLSQQDQDAVVKKSEPTAANA